MQKPQVLHLVKWYPHPHDPQNGIFVKKHIDAATPEAPVLGFLNGHFPTIKEGKRVLHGAERMSISAKIALFYGALAEHKPEIIHFHCYANDLVPLLWIARSRHLKTVHSEHWSGLLPSNAPAVRGIKRILTRWYFNRTHAVAPVSRLLADGIESVAPKAKIQVIANVVSDVPSAPTQPFTTTSFCAVGDVVFDIKRQDLLLDTFAKMPRMQCELHFYGGGPDLETLRERASRVPNVFVHGRLTNQQVLEVLPSHHAHVLFSSYETFGVTTLEARKAGLWAISKADFGSSSYADDHTLLVANTSELLEAMNTVLKKEPASKNPYVELSSSAIGSEILGLYQELKS